MSPSKPEAVTTLQFKNADLRWVKKNFNVVGGRTLLELRGVCRLPLELATPPKEFICCSRSFSATSSEYKYLHNALSCYLMTAKKRFIWQRRPSGNGG